MDSSLRIINHYLRSLPPWAVSLMVFVTVISICFGLYLIWQGLRRKPSLEEQKKRDIELAELETVIKLTKKDKRNGFDRWFSQLLEESDSKLSPLTASLIILGVLLCSGAAVFLFTDNVPLSIGSGMIFMVFPLFYWFVRRYWRIRQMRRHLPETLEAIGDAIRGGLTFEETMEMTAQQIEEPLRAEFEYANRQISMGQTPELVMDRMSRRIPISEFRIFATAVLVHRTTGGNLGMLAERLARTTRDRSEFQGHLNAISAGSRMSIIGLVIVTGLAIMVLCGLDTSYLYKFLLNPYGPVLLGITAALFIIGSYWAWSIMRVKY